MGLLAPKSAVGEPEGRFEEDCIEPPTDPHTDVIAKP